MKIFLNPGHAAGFDSGAVAFNLRECDVNFGIAKELKILLERLGHEVKLFVSDSLQEICDAADNSNADIFVSIHCNASKDGGRGTETFYYSDAGAEIAAKVQREIVKSLGTVDRGIKFANFYVLKNTSITAILIECAFIDNLEDNKLLKNYQYKFALAIAQGLC